MSLLAGADHISNLLSEASSMLGINLSPSEKIIYRYYEAHFNLGIDWAFQAFFVL